jgi:UDP-N-acetylglucosamine 2-epimerase
VIKIGVVTVGRSDFGLYRPLLQRIKLDRKLKLMLFVSGAHLSRRHGRTIREIEESGFPVTERIPMLLDADDPSAIGTSMGRGVMGFSKAYARNCPDILVVLGDRFEMHAAALAALPFNIPVAHIHGWGGHRGRH